MLTSTPSTFATELAHDTKQVELNAQSSILSLAAKWYGASRFTRYSTRRRCYTRLSLDASCVKWDTMVEVMRSRLMELLAGCLAVCDMSPGALK